MLLVNVVLTTDGSGWSVEFTLIQNHIFRFLLIASDYQDENRLFAVSLSPSARSNWRLTSTSCNLFPLAITRFQMSTGCIPYVSRHISPTWQLLGPQTYTHQSISFPLILDPSSNHAGLQTLPSFPENMRMSTSVPSSLFST